MNIWLETEWMTQIMDFHNGSHQPGHFLGSLRFCTHVRCTLHQPGTRGAGTRDDGEVPAEIRAMQMVPNRVQEFRDWSSWFDTHRIHGAAIYGNMDPINIPPLC